MLRFSAALRVTGSDLDPEIVSNMLGLRADQGHRRGDPNIGKSGRIYSHFAEGLWLKKSAVSRSRPLEDHLDDLASKLIDRQGVFEELEKRGWQADIFIGVLGIGGNSVFRISPQTQKRLAVLGLELTFDVYSS